MDRFVARCDFFCHRVPKEPFQEPVGKLSPLIKTLNQICCEPFDQLRKFTLLFFGLQKEVL